MNPESQNPLDSSNPQETIPIKSVENLDPKPEQDLELPKDNNPEQIQVLESNLQRKEQVVARDETKLKEIRESLGLSQDNVEAPALAIEKEKLSEMQEKLQAYKGVDSSINYVEIISDLQKKLPTDNVQEKISLADEALAQLQTENKLLEEKITAEKKRIEELRQSGKWDGTQKSELRSLNQKSDTLYGREQDLRRLKKEMEKGLKPLKPDNIKEIQTGDNNPEHSSENSQDRATSFKELSSELGELEHTIRGNGFNRFPLHIEDFQRAMSGDNIDMRKVNDVIQFLATTFKKGLMPENPQERLQLEPQNFTRMIDSLEDTIKVVYRLKNSLKETPSDKNEKQDIEDLDQNCGSLIGSMNGQIEYLKESRSLIERLRGR
ncbi:MAG: hypothetical protein AAB470_00005 [Patescibacteria group bacterium]